MCAPRASASTSSGCAYSRSIRSRTRRRRARSLRRWAAAWSAVIDVIVPHRLGTGVERRRARPWRLGRLGAALGALAVEHDLVLGHGEGDAAREAVDGALEVIVGEGLHVAAAIADHVVMVVAVGARGLVARRALADLDARDERKPHELVEHAIDRGAGHAAAVGAQGVLDLVGAQGAGLAVEQRDDRGARAAASEAGLGEAAIGVLGPRRHRSRW